MRKIEIDCVDDYRTLLALEVDRHISRADAEAIVEQFKEHKWMYAKIRHDTFPGECDVLETGVKCPRVSIVNREENESEEKAFKLEYTLKF